MSEYLVTVGLLATIAVVFNRVLSDALRGFVRGVALAVRTIAP